jgi:hypothetical protein
MFMNSRSVWNVRATPSRAMACGGRPAIDSADPGWAENLTSPALGSYTPVITLKTVVLPAPFGPMTLTTSRSPTCRSSDRARSRRTTRRLSREGSKSRRSGTSTRPRSARATLRAVIITMRIAPIISS